MNKRKSLCSSPLMILPSSPGNSSIVKPATAVLRSNTFICCISLPNSNFHRLGSTTLKQFNFHKQFGHAAVSELVMLIESGNFLRHTRSYADCSFDWFLLLDSYLFSDHQCSHKTKLWQLYTKMGKIAHKK